MQKDEKDKKNETSKNKFSEENVKLSVHFNENKGNKSNYFKQYKNQKIYI